MHPTYAPELNIKGAAMGKLEPESRFSSLTHLGGVCPNVTAVMLQVNGGGYAGLIPAGITGFKNTYPQVSQLLDEVILPQYVGEFDDAGNQCMGTNMGQYANLNFFNWTTNGQQFLYDNRIAPILTQNTLAASTFAPKIPIYMYHSASDEVAPVGEVDKVYNSYCAKGVTVTYVKNPWANHVMNMVEGSGGAFTWLQARLNGASYLKTCTSVVLPFGGALLPANAAVVASDLASLLGVIVGDTLANL